MLVFHGSKSFRIACHDRTMSNHKINLIDIIGRNEYEKYLYRCLAPLPFRRYRKRSTYLDQAVPKGFHKVLLIFDKGVVGQIEYAPAEASYYPIFGDGIIVMNCIWVLRKAKGHGFGRMLLNFMIQREKNAKGFATIALEDHWSPWLKKEHIEKLGFTSIDSINVKHKEKHRDECFKIHLMWMPASKEASPPRWDKLKLLEGVDFCLAHPLYRPERLKGKKILEIC